MALLNFKFIDDAASRAKFVKLLSTPALVAYFKALMPIAYPRRPITEVFGTEAMKKIVAAFGLDTDAETISYPSVV